MPEGRSIAACSSKHILIGRCPPAAYTFALESRIMTNGMTRIFREFISSKKSEGIILIVCTVVSLIIANSGSGTSYLHLLHRHVDLSFAGLDLDFSVEHWINDGL